MKYFLDTEFIEDGKTIDLVSIGIVAEDGRELYLGNADCCFSRASSWVRENVLIHIDGLEDNLNFLSANCDRDFWKSKSAIKQEIINFIWPDWEYRTKKEAEGIDFTPSFWAYYADYDWVVLCQLFGKMIDLPEGFPMYCKDIKQELDRLGITPEPQKEGEHNALEDAKYNKLLYDTYIEGT